MTKKNEEKLYRGYTVRLLPTPEQEERMRKHIDNCRFIWNYMLEVQTNRYNINKKRYMSKYEMCAEITYMKKHEEYSFLKETPLHSMQQVCGDLDEAFQMFFKKLHNYPNFKRKKDTKMSYPLDPDGMSTYFKNESVVHIQRVGDVKCKTDRKIPTGRGSKICDPQIHYEKSSGKWLLTFVLPKDKKDVELTGNVMGIDLGIENLAIVSFGEEKIVFPNINKSKSMKKLDKKQKHIKRVIDRKYRTYNGYGTPNKGQSWEKSKNIEKYEQILREIDRKRSNIRHDYIHKITRQLVDMKPKRVVMESIVVSEVVKNKPFAKDILEANWFYFINTMKYKCEEYGIEFVQADRWFPSSKLCSNCGYKNKDLKLSDRNWTCPVCNTKHNRDYNAAINLMNYTGK